MRSEYQIVLANGKIVDGCGNPWFWGDLAIQDGRIARIGRPGRLTGAQIIDLQGRYVTPGFIDIHTHSDLTILINVLANDSDIDGTLDVTSVSVTTSPVNGTANVNALTGEITKIRSAIDIVKSDLINLTSQHAQ